MKIVDKGIVAMSDAEDAQDDEEYEKDLIERAKKLEKEVKESGFDDGMDTDDEGEIPEQAQLPITARLPCDPSSPNGSHKWKFIGNLPPSPLASIPRGNWVCIYCKRNLHLPLGQKP